MELGHKMTSLVYANTHDFIIISGFLTLSLYNERDSDREREREAN